MSPPPRSRKHKTTDKGKKKSEPTESNICDLLICENAAGGRGMHTTVGVLEPVMRIERTGDRRDRNDNSIEEYRIILYFKLQVKIHAFEKGYLKKHDQLFDFISLRYLYSDTNQIRHEVIPGADPLTAFNTTDETTKTKSFDVGVSGTPASGGVSPSLSYHIGRDNRVSYERTDSKSWKKGLSFESYYPYRHTHEYGYEGHSKVGEHQRSGHFQVQSKHRKIKCICPKNLKRFSGSESYRTSYPELPSSSFYDRCAHWFWQTEAMAHLWTPEIYDSFTEPITVTRIISTKKFDRTRQDEADSIIKATKHSKYRTEIKMDDILGTIPEMGIPYLHFDFAVTTRLRELGHLSTADGIGGKFHSLFTTHSKPAEVRAKRDFGYPLTRNRVTFCIWACPAEIKWPLRPTRQLQKSVATKIETKGGRLIRTISTPEEYGKERRKEDKDRSRKDAKEAERRARKEATKMNNETISSRPGHLGMHHHHLCRDDWNCGQKDTSCCSEEEEVIFNHCPEDHGECASRYHHLHRKNHIACDSEVSRSESELDSEVENRRGRRLSRGARDSRCFHQAQKCRRCPLQCKCQHRNPSDSSNAAISLSLNSVIDISQTRSKSKTGHSRRRRADERIIEDEGVNHGERVENETGVELETSGQEDSGNDSCYSLSSGGYRPDPESESEPEPPQQMDNLEDTTRHRHRERDPYRKEHGKHRPEFHNLYEPSRSHNNHKTHSHERHHHHHNGGRSHAHTYIIEDYRARSSLR